jgi:CubicO group peptidase (beta-lactamase class C family)
VFETDATGNLVGSSYIYATARDFGRFGLLYLNDGIFNNVRLLPEGWVGYTTTPAPCSSGAYGAHFWLNRNKYYPDAPADMFCANGHDGQRIFIIPSKELVVVILGYSPKSSGGMDFNRLFRDILACYL